MSGIRHFLEEWHKAQQQKMKINLSSRMLQAMDEDLALSLLSNQRIVDIVWINLADSTRDHRKEFIKKGGCLIFMCLPLKL